jgi:prevent-host-death family protein
MARSVGVHEAKTHLSRLLADVAAGEQIVITRRGEAVASLVPATGVATRNFGIDRGRSWFPSILTPRCPSG